ncbi:MAG: class I SAM-dependent methyltransferase [Eubacteriales bacterium]|nr:class I SAM-dependent methyltransferase [Eubacteriales bacterium]
MAIRLTKRLKAVADYVDTHRAVADIGCDHGKLALYLAQAGCPKVLGCDISRPSLEKAHRLKAQYAQPNLELRTGDGLAAVTPGEVSALVLSGMGGSTIARILGRHPDVLCRVEQLVLSPHSELAQVYDFLARNGFYLADEAIVHDAGRLYRVLLAHRGVMPAPDDAFCGEFGSILPVKRPEHYDTLLRRQIRLGSAVLAARQAAGEASVGELVAFLNKCREELACLSPSRN